MGIDSDRMIGASAKILVPLSELEKIPYLNTSAIKGRVPFVLPWWDGKSWRHWICVEQEVIELSLYGNDHGLYYSSEQQDSHDLNVAFINFVVQHASWGKNHRILSAIADDLHAIASSIGKLYLIHSSQATLGVGASSQFALTEFEYLILTLRSIFDLAYEIFRNTWNDVTLNDAGLNERKRQNQLPKKLSKLLLDGTSSAVTSSSLQERYAIPISIAERLLKDAEFFKWIRAIRDNIAHGIQRSPIVFSTPDGFCFQKDTPIFTSQVALEDRFLHNDHIVSVLPWLARMVDGTLESCNSIVTALHGYVDFAEEIAPGQKVFLRGYAIPYLVEFRRGHIWWDENSFDVVKEKFPVRKS